MKKAIVYILGFMILLTGCVRNPSPQNSHQADAGVLPGETGNEARTYMAETWDAGITPDYQPLSNSFVLTEDMLYYVDRSEGWDICGVVLSGQARPQRILRMEDGCIEAIAAVSGADGESILALAGKDGTGASSLAAYTLDGRRLWQQTYEAQGQTAWRLVQDGSGHFYIMCDEQVFLFDKDGVLQGSISCPGEAYIDICAVSGGSVYVSYRDGQAERPMLARLQYQGCRLEGELRISGSGCLGAGREGSLLFQNGNEIYAYVPQKQEAGKLLDLAVYDLAGEQLRTMLTTSSGEIVLVSWELLQYGSPVWVTRLKEATEGQPAEDGRQIITWLIVGADVTDAEQTAVAFNRQNRDYRVVVEQVSLERMAHTDNTTQYDLYEDIYMCVNTRLLASESADLISFSTYQEMERYLEKGYLEDLTPYIARSERISREDYLEQVVEYNARGDALYCIPPDFCIGTLMGKESELGAEPGWTVEEFLDWLARHPDAVTQEGLTKEKVLDFCLMGTLDEYLSRESGRCNFEEEAFQELLRRIGGLTTDGAGHWDDWWEQLEEKPAIEQGWVSAFPQCYSWESMYGEPLVYKGYPSKDGTPCHYYIGGGLAILSRSTCKEGAYAFWEYYLLEYSKDYPNYYTDKKAFADSMARTADEQWAYTDDGHRIERKLSEIPSAAAGEDEELEWISAMNEEQRDKQLAMLEHVQIDSLENQVIRNLICEEAAGYFAGVKNLEDTCRVIQSRVGVYLAERLEPNP